MSDLSFGSGGGGYALAKTLLDAYQKDLKRVLLSDYGKDRKSQECDWLELKQFDEKTDRATWKVVRALLSLANLSGGLLVIGVDDDGVLIPAKHPLVRK